MTSAADQAQALTVAHRLVCCGARKGAAQVLFHAALMAQRESAQLRDLSQRPVFGRRAVAAPHSEPANDHGAVSPSSTA
jgi:hypothetical protein